MAEKPFSDPSWGSLMCLVPGAAGSPWKARGSCCPLSCWASGPGQSSLNDVCCPRALVPICPQAAWHLRASLSSPVLGSDVCACSRAKGLSRLSQHSEMRPAQRNEAAATGTCPQPVYSTQPKPGRGREPGANCLAELGPSCCLRDNTGPAWLLPELLHPEASIQAPSPAAFPAHQRHSSIPRRPLQAPSSGLWWAGAGSVLLFWK